VTSNQIISASGASALKVHSTADADFPLAQTIEAAHKIGCHHVVTSRNGENAASIGFDGEIKIWACGNGTWSEVTKLSSKIHYTVAFENVFSNLPRADVLKQSDAWAITLSDDAKYLAATTHDVHIKVWDLASNGEQFRSYETKGTFGTCIDMVRQHISTQSKHIPD
jgi:superkiller protein 8